MSKQKTPFQIWVIYQFRLLEKKFPEINRNRLGFYFSKEEAILAVKNNIGGMDECGYYSHVLIKSFNPGIYSWYLEKTTQGFPTEILWFEWKNCEFVLTEVPNEYKVNGQLLLNL